MTDASRPSGSGSYRDTHAVGPQGLLWLVAIGFFMETLDSTIVNTALPSMAKSLGESPLRMHAVIIAYSLTLAVLIPASGWLADKFGIRKAFFSAILIFSLGSLCCALSQNLTHIVMSRILQGIGGCMMMPIGRLAVLRNFPGSQFLAAISFVTIPAMIGPLIGPTLGGWLVEVASWHWIFLINLPIGLVGCVATYFYMKDDPDHMPSTKFDMSGFVRLAAFMVSASLSLDGLSEVGPHSVTSIVMGIFLTCGTHFLHPAREPPLRCFVFSGTLQSSYIQHWFSRQSLFAPGKQRSSVFNSAPFSNHTWLFATSGRNDDDSDRRCRSDREAVRDGVD